MMYILVCFATRKHHQRMKSPFFAYATGFPASIAVPCVTLHKYFWVNGITGHAIQCSGEGDCQMSTHNSQKQIIAWPKLTLWLYTSGQTRDCVIHMSTTVEVVPLCLCLNLFHKRKSLLSIRLWVTQGGRHKKWPSILWISNRGKVFMRTYENV